jgi:hypothetical protein
MNAHTNLLKNTVRKTSRFLVGILAGVALAGVVVHAADAAKAAGDDKARDESTIQTGSGKMYQTTVQRDTKGELDSKDLHQVSLLTSRIVGHLNESIRCLLDDNADAAKPEIEKGRQLVKIVRDLLPVTTVTTTVKDAKGKEVYRDIAEVQDDRIPLYQGAIEVNVIEPVVEAQEEEAKLKGLRLADAGLLRTSVLVDLTYVERKLNRAAELLDKPEDALKQLALAQTRGIEVAVDEEDHPLVAVQSALRLAERMVEEGKQDAAKSNLQLAQIHLETYKALLSKEAGEKVKKLQDDIAELSGKLAVQDAADKVREFWERVVSWFQEKRGQAVTTDNEAETEPAK